MTYTARQQRSGYVLLITLILVMLAGLALVGAARASLRQASAASEAQRELQERWGTLSCRRVLLARVEQTLRAEEVRQRKPISVVHLELLLGGQPFDLILADEQAKANVNTLLSAGQDLRDAETRLRTLLSGTGTTTHLRLRVASDRAGGESSGVRSFGQVFDLPPSSPVLLEGHAPATERITCWGSGRLNFRRASEQAMREVCVPMLDVGQIRQLIAFRQDSPLMTLSEGLARLQLPAERRIRAQALLADGSDCHSIGVITHREQHPRYTLCVRESAASQGMADILFSYP